MGFGIFLYKFLVMGFPLSPETMVDVWNVEVRLTFTAMNEPLKVTLFIPRSSQDFVITSENFISRGYGLTTSTKNLNRQAVWAINKAKGRQRLYYLFVISPVKTMSTTDISTPPRLEDPGFDGPFLSAAESLLSEIHAQSSDLDSFVTELTKYLRKPYSDENVALLIDKDTSVYKRVEIATRILALAGIPAQVVNGIQVKEQIRDAGLIHWLEIYDKDKNRWRSFDPFTGDAGVPDNYMAWWRGVDPLVRLNGVEKMDTNISVTLNQEEAINAAINRGKLTSPGFLKFSLLSLPIHTQAVYRILILVPAGVLLLVFLRNMIGVKTFGTFMPVLIAMAFRETQLLWGIVLFSVLVSLGLGIRFYLERFKILLVPRLASVLIIVILLMGIISIFTHKLGLELGLSVALFPMVVLTMTIERMTIVWEEQGVNEALQQGIGSLLVASFVYLLMNNKYIGHMVFIFPELLLVFLACTLMIGRYTGYRLLELRRFAKLAEDETT